MKDSKGEGSPPPSHPSSQSWQEGKRTRQHAADPILIFLCLFCNWRTKPPHSTLGGLEPVNYSLYITFSNLMLKTIDEANQSCCGFIDLWLMLTWLQSLGIDSKILLFTSWGMLLATHDVLNATVIASNTLQLSTLNCICHWLVQRERRSRFD